MNEQLELNMSKKTEKSLTVPTEFDDNNALIDSFVIKAMDQADVQPTPNKLPEDRFHKGGLDNKIIPPPYDPLRLAVLAESSSILNQCVDVMEVNCDSFGYEFNPSVDDETFKKLQEEQEKAVGVRVDDTGTKTDKPNRQETEIELEYRRLSNFFKYVNRTLSFTQIRRRTRRDYELTGNGYWEILRNHITHKITGLEWLPSSTVRIGRVDRYFTDCKSKRKVSDTEIEEIPDKRKFRRYCQISEDGSKPVWFKEFGDPRIMDADTGAMAYVTLNDAGKVTQITAIEDERYSAFDVAKFKAGKMRVGNEILHFMNYNNVRSLPYGTPRWMGNLISIIGSRSAEEINVLYFDNKTVPPGMLLVSGGKITKNAVDRITNHVKDTVKGKKNYHSILVVEAENKVHPNMPAPSVPKLEWINMVNAQHNDALFQKYDQFNIDKIVSSFRFWPGYVSRTKDVNRATADTAKKLSEEQVFAPERNEFDSVINRNLLVDMNVNYYEFQSKGPELTTAEDKVNILDKTKAFLTAKEARSVVSSILGRDLEALDEENWVKLPIAITQAMIQNPQALEAILPQDIGGPIKEERLASEAIERDLKIQQTQAKIENDKKNSDAKAAAAGAKTAATGLKPAEAQEVAKFVTKLQQVKKVLGDIDMLPGRK